MRSGEIILYSLGASAIGVITYFALRNAFTPPPEPTPEEIQMRFEEYLEQQEWLAEDGYYA